MNCLQCALFIFCNTYTISCPPTSYISSVTILLFLFTLHFYSLPLLSLLSQLYSLLKLLIVFQCLLPIITVTLVVL